MGVDQPSYAAAENEHEPRTSASELQALRTSIEGQPERSDLSVVDFFGLGLDEISRLCLEPDPDDLEYEVGDQYEAAFPNYEIYLETTLDDLFPAEVRSVSVDGIIGTRQGVMGQFYADTGGRLIVHNGSQIEIVDVDENADALYASMNERLNDSSDTTKTYAQMYQIDEQLLKTVINTEDLAIPGYGPIDRHSYADMRRLVTEIERNISRYQQYTGEYAQEDGIMTDGATAYIMMELARSMPQLVSSERLVSLSDLIPESLRTLHLQDYELKKDTSVNRELLNSGQGVDIQTVDAYTEKIQNAANRIKEHQSRYERIAMIVNMPWELVGAIHYRESNLEFNTYLHNGDPLGTPTTHVPKGIYFENWDDAAIDALKRVGERYSIESDASYYEMAEYAERYNGLGYRMRDLPSPYVYAGTDQYEGGLFVADGKFDPDRKDQRPGVLPVIQYLRS